MRRLTILLIAIILILGFCIGAALFLPTLQPQPKPPVNVTPKSLGITEIHQSALIQPIDMQFAKNEVNTYQPYPAVNRTNQTLHYIRATNLNGAGDATSWVFGIHENNMTTLYTYDRNGVARIPWDAGLPDQQINLSTVLTPGELITLARIQMPVTDSSQAQTGVILELMDGDYTITYPPGNLPQTITFNATTGALISVHD
jgi:hypothetical protein